MIYIYRPIIKYFYDLKEGQWIGLKGTFPSSPLPTNFYHVVCQGLDGRWWKGLKQYIDII